MAYRLLLTVLFLAGAGYTLMARRIPMDPWTAEELVNARTLPTLYGVLLCLVVLLLFLRARPVAAGEAGLRLIRAGGICLLVVAFTAALAWIPLWVSLGLLLVASAAWLGERRWPALLALGLGMPLAGFIGIEWLLGVYLPE